MRFCDCDTEGDVCNWKEQCDTRHVWSLLAKQMNNLLDSITLAGVLADLEQGGTNP